MSAHSASPSIVLLGCGSIGRRHARVLTGIGVSRLTVFDPVAAQMDQLAHEVPTAVRAPTLEAALESRPDAVFVLTPPQTHIPLALRAIENGAHVFSEKPLSDTLDGVDKLARVAEDARRIVMVGLCFRFHDGVVAAKRLVDAGTIGRIVSVRAVMGEHLPTVRPDFRTLFTSTISGAFDLMHDIDLAIWLADASVRDVKSSFGTCSDIGISAPDVVEIIVDFDKPVVASIHLDFFQQPRRRQIELYGTKGTAVLEFASWTTCTLSWWESDSGAWKATTLATERDDMFRAEDSRFIDAITASGTVECGISEARKSLEVVAKASR